MDKIIKNRIQLLLGVTFKQSQLKEALKQDVECEIKAICENHNFQIKPFTVTCSNDGMTIELTLPIPLPVFGEIAQIIDDTEDRITGKIIPLGDDVRLEYIWEL